ncbi:MAG: hypothetical protein ACPG8W_01770 [Candidatus Promineifilaceae bacterium]
MGFEDFETNLRHRFYRFDCMSLDMLREYTVGMISAEDRPKVEAHLVTCSLCRNELQELQDKLSVEVDPIADQGWDLQRGFEVFIASLMETSFGIPTAQYRKSDTRKVLYETKDDTVISIDWHQDDRGYISITGLILADDADETGKLRLLDLQGKTKTITVFLDKTGGFFISNLNPGQYQLTIQLSDRQIVMPLSLPI